MKIIKAIANFIGILVSLVLSLALIVMLSVTPLVYTLSETLEPAKIQELAQTGFDSLLSQQSELVIQEMTDAGIPPDTITAALETEAVKEVIQLYVEDVFAELKGETGGLTPQALRAIVETHMDELLPIARDLAGTMLEEEIELSDEDLEEAMLDMVDMFGPELIDQLPSAEDLDLVEPGSGGEMLSVWDAETLERLSNGELSMRQMIGLLGQVVELFYGGRVLRAVVIAVCVLSVLILIFRIGGFRGFTWLAFNFLIGGLPCLCVGFTGRTTLMQLSVKAAELGMISDMAGPVLDQMMIVSGVICVMGILFGIVSAKGDEFLRRRRMQKRAEQNA